MNIKEKQDEIISDFSFFDDWTQKYEHIIDLGKELPLIDPLLKTEDYLIKGCQSQVWLFATLGEDQNVYYTADSDAIITKGLISLLIDALSGQAAEDIISSEIYFIDKIGLKSHLSPTRSNGLASMLQQMKQYALAFQKQTLKNNN